MAAAKQNLVIEQGATWRDTLVLYQPCPKGTAIEDMVPMDLTGFVVAMQIRDSYESPSALLSLTTDNGRLTVIPKEGTIIRSITAVDTRNLVPIAAAVYDLELTHPSGEVTRLVQGRVAISPEVTK